ncbi:GTP pyrophosphokinase [Pseudomonas siliginis]|uniref:GTP pyrophosphokinase n=1 Tax=Pseudomonas siliginis TaxID=2842346 RepID=UPI003D64E4F3
MTQDLSSWLAETLPKYQALTSLVSSIMASLMQGDKIDYLAISSRVKDTESALEKVRRKNYTSPAEQLTDLGGIRIIVFFESDLVRVSNLIERSFTIDVKNSSDKERQMSVDQTGYRSVHFVCDMGEARFVLPEYKNLKGLKFEFQVRTVLQHAWAELAHDRNYKFAGKLPEDAERKLYLYAGMLELADKGLDELSREMDAHIAQVQEDIKSGSLESPIDSVALVRFVDEWAARHSVQLKSLKPKSGYEDLINELNSFGVHTLAQLMAIVPVDYHEHISVDRTIYGVVRDWMLISDWRGFAERVSYDWVYEDNGDDPLWAYLSEEERLAFQQVYNVVPRGYGHHLDD